MKNSDNRRYIYILPIACALAMVIGLFGGVYFAARLGVANSGNPKLNQVLSLIADRYVDPVDMDSLVEASLPDILEGLDPHTVYVAADDRQVAERDLESSFFGVGISFQMIDDTLHVMEVIPNGPAEREGIKAGDRFTRVDGKDIAGQGISTNEVFKMLRGPKGTPVDIEVRRTNSPTPLEFTIIRDIIPVNSIDASYIIAPGVGYMHIGKFTDSTYPEFLSESVQLKFDGAQKLIIDLRGNGGGYMNPAVLMANEFLPPEALIVSTRGRLVHKNADIRADGSGNFRDMPVAILVDEFTASSSEIFAGAMQDNDRATVIGRRTFGKGLVQEQFEMADSSKILLTVQRYYTPSGRCIQKKFDKGRDKYSEEIFDRYSHGEIFHADSIRLDSALIFHTVSGREVYGGGGIMPDVFVPSDTTGVTSYYINVSNKGLIQKFAYEYCDINRDNLSEAQDMAQLMKMLPPDNVLLGSFVRYAARNGVAPRWYYIEPSRNLIVNQIKAVIARDTFGLGGYYEVVNATDKVVLKALEQLGGNDQTKK